MSTVVDPTLSYGFKALADGSYTVKTMSQLESCFLIRFNFVFTFGAHAFSIQTVGVQVITLCTPSFSFCWLRGLAFCPTGNFG